MIDRKRDARWMRRSLCVISAAVLAAVAGCAAESPGTKPHTYTAPDAGPAQEALEAPKLSQVPSVTPLQTVAVRGTTKGASIVVQGGLDGTVVGVPLPSGDYCVDVPLPQSGAVTLKLTTLRDGEISPPVELTVTRDPTAPKPSSPYCTPPICGGQACPDKETDCGDQQDNDYDGWIDECDLDCSGCTDDPYEPNDYPASVPSLEKGSYVGMQICPCHDDWFAFYREEGEWVKVSAERQQGRVSLRLFRAEEAEDGGYESNRPVKYGVLKDSDSVWIEWEVDKTGWYYVFAYSPDDAAASYKLVVY